MRAELPLANSLLSASFTDNALPKHDLWTTDELISPKQFVSIPTHEASTNVYDRWPEAALMRAVLEDAINCFRNQFHSTGRRQQRLAREAEEWLFSDDSHWPFSFLHICAVLGLDPEYIRLGLKRLSQHRPVWLHKRKRRVTSMRLLKIAA